MSASGRTDDQKLRDCYRYFNLTPEDGPDRAEVSYESLQACGNNQRSHDQAIAYIRWHSDQSAKSVTEMKPVLNEDELAQHLERTQFDAPPITKGALITDASALPAALLLGWLISQSPLMWIFNGFRIWSHEFGHATIAWFSGYRAIPLPIGWTNVEDEKSLVVTACLFILLAIFAAAGVREKKTWPIILAALLIALQIWMTWNLKPRRYFVLMNWAGIGGEFYLNTLLIAAFYARMPEKFRWPVCRFIFLVLCSVSFVAAWVHWADISSGQESIPYGTLVGGADDTGGDMDQLRSCEWTEEDITRSYNVARFSCAGLLVVVYVTAMITRLGAWRQNPESTA